jgi:hypothetical protein
MLHCSRKRLSPPNAADLFGPPPIPGGRPHVEQRVQSVAENGRSGWFRSVEDPAGILGIAPAFDET